jgi:hypothetical protein
MELATGILGYKSDRTIRAWAKTDPTIIDRIAELSGVSSLFKHRAAVYSALAESAQVVGSSGNSDRKLYLEIIGDYVPTQTVEHKIKQELESLLLVLQQALNPEQYESVLRAIAAAQSG